MRNIASKLALAAVLAAGLAAPALADVDAIASINKTKDVSVSETISITKTIDVTVTVDRALNASAQASAIVNAGISDDTVNRDVPGELSNIPDTNNSNDDGAIVRAASIDGLATGSINDNIGVTGVNQDVGDMTNQGNIWSVAFSDDGGSLFTDAQAEVSQRNTFNSVSFIDTEGGRDGQVLFTASIDGSINGNEGITSVNQNAGNMNNQTNAVAAAAGLQSGTSVAVGGATVALAESALGQENSGNSVTETTIAGTEKEADIFASISGNIGVTQVNQSVGNIGNQGNVVAVGAAIIGLTN